MFFFLPLNFARFLLLQIFFVFFLVTKVQAAEFIEIDFSQASGSASPYIYGVAHIPAPSFWPDAMIKMRDQGITIVREDVFMEDLVPNSTIQNYKNNVNNIKDISTWDRGRLDFKKNKYCTSQQYGMKVLSIVSYSPGWLSHNGKDIGVPKDWEVYEDIVEKIYRYMRPCYDYVEVWNEPNLAQFLDVSGSGLTVNQAYDLIYKHTVNALRRVDPNIKIIAPSSYRYTDQLFMDTFLSTASNRTYLSGVSTHWYPGSNAFITPMTKTTTDSMKRYSAGSKQLWVSEWNHFANTLSDTHTEPRGISFVGRSLIEMIKSGVYGANYYSGRNFLGRGEKAFFTWNSSTKKAEPLPPTRAFFLASKILSLGSGTSQFYKTSKTASIDAIGLKNPLGQYVVYLSNDSSGTKTSRVQLSGISGVSRATLTLHKADASDKGVTSYKTVTSNLASGKLSFDVEMGAHSVHAGIISFEQNVSPTGSTAPITATPTRVAVNCRADINQNGRVDIEDYAILVSDFFRSPPSNPLSDIDQNGVVDVRDYSELVSSFFQVCAVTATPNTSLKINSLTLINAANDSDVRSLSSTDTVILSQLPQFSLRANVGSQVKSVRFVVSGGVSLTKTENAAPFAISDNSPTDYFPWSVNPGVYTIKVSGYSASNGQGSAGPTQTYLLTVR